MFFGYISERSFLMVEFPMDDWRNNFDHFVNDVEISTETLPRDIVIIDDGLENKDRPNVNPIGDINQVNPVFTVDDTGYSGDDPDAQPCSVSDSLSLPNDEVNEDRADKSTDCTLNDEGAIHKIDENESARPVDIITITDDSSIGLDNQLINTPSLMDAHPSWNCLVFQTSPSRPGRKTKVRVTAEEKAKFNTLVFSSFLGTKRHNASLISSTSKSNYTELTGIKKGIFYGLTIFFKGNCINIIIC